MSSDIIIQLASVPEREQSLHITIASLLPQADRIYVNLNGYDKIPKFLLHPKIEVNLFDNSMGDAVKFYDVEKREGYVLTCDDDMVYPPDYVSYMKCMVDKYRCVVSLMGKRYDYRPIVSFRHGYTELYRAYGTVHEDRQVHIGGTGVMAFHTDYIKVKYSDFKKPNMADIWMAKAAYEQDVPIMVVAHTRFFVMYLPQVKTIWNRCENSQYQTDLVNSFLKDIGADITNNSITAPGNQA